MLTICCLLVGNEVQFDKVKLSEMFEMIISDSFEQFLGIDFNYNKESNILKMSQKKGIREVLRFINMEDCNSVATPMDKSIQLENTREK